METIFDLFPGIQVYDKENVDVKNPFSGETFNRRSHFAFQFLLQGDGKRQ